MQCEWKEAEDRADRISECHIETFSLYVRVIYAGHVDIADEAEAGDEYQTLGVLYILTKSLCDDKTKDRVVTAMAGMEVSKVKLSNSLVRSLLAYWLILTS